MILQQNASALSAALAPLKHSALRRSGPAKTKAVCWHESFLLAQPALVAQAGTGQRTVLQEKGNIQEFDLPALDARSPWEKAPAPSTGGPKAHCLC